MADPKNSAFLLSSATVMIGAYGGAVPVFDLDPTNHSVGMVKNVKISMTSSEIELRNGIQQNLVDSLKSGVKLSASFEGYEFSAKNLQLSLGIAGTPIQYLRGKLNTTPTALATSITVVADAVPGESATWPASPAIGDIPAGSTLLIQKLGAGDIVFPVKTTAAATFASGVFTLAISALPAGMSFAAGDRVWVANALAVGSTAPLDYFCMKIAGTLSGNDKPAVMIFPKIKIVKGFDMNFNETQYSNLPFEISPYFLTAAEVTGRLSEIGTNAQGRLYVAG